MRNIIAAPAKGPSTVHSVVWNYFGYACQIGINFGFTSYVARHISVSEYGLFLFVMSLSASLYILDIGISYLLIQAYVALFEKSDTESLNDLISTAFLALTGLASIGVLIFWALSMSLPGPFNIPHQYLHEASVIFVLAGLTMQVSLPTVALELLYQASRRFDRINQIQLITSAINLVFSVLVLAMGFHIVALASVQLAVSMLRMQLFRAALPATVQGARLSLLRFRWSLLKPLIKLSRWALLQNLSTYLLELIIWSILGSFASMREAAIYGLASRPPRQLSNLVDKGGNVLLPLLSKASVQGDLVSLQATYLKAQKLIFGAVFPFVVLGCVFARPLLQIWIGDQYSSVAIVMRCLLLSALGSAMAYPSDELLYACGRARRSALISFCSSSAATACALLLVPHYGAVGLAAAIAVTQLLLSCSWFTLESCKLLHIDPSALLKTVLDGLMWPTITLVAEMALICSIWQLMSPVWLVLAALFTGSVYLGLWGFQTAIPLFRSRTEIVA